MPDMYLHMYLQRHSYRIYILQVGLTVERLDDPNADTHVQPVLVLRNDGGGGGGGGGDAFDWDSILGKKSRQK